MDNFMDRLAQRINAQEMIRANVAAETEELEHLREQVEAYDASLRKMQLMSDTHAENVVKLEAILDAYSSKLNNYSSELNAYGSELAQYATRLDQLQLTVADGESDKPYATKEELDASLEQMISEMSGVLAGAQDHIEDFSHKENVKVYRNVQAAVGEELGKKTEDILTALKEQNQTMQRKYDEVSRQIEGMQALINEVREDSKNGSAKTMIVLQIMTLIAIFADIATLLLGLWGLL